MHFGLFLDFLKERLSQQKELRVEPKEIDIVRAYMFGHVPRNVSDRDKLDAAAIETFYEIVEREFGYDVELVDIDYGGRRLRAIDRFAENPDDEWTPREKRVDVALASSMLFYAAIPYAYDIAIPVIGDEDFVPVLQKVRSLGRRVAIASIKTRRNSPCSHVYSAEYDEEGIRDFDVIWLNELASKVQVPQRIIQCQDPNHVGRPQSVTTALQVPGRPDVCDDCRDRSRVERRKTMAGLTEKMQEIESRGWPSHCGLACGVVAAKKIDKNNKPYAFVKAKVNERPYDFYMNQYDLEPGLSWDSIAELDILVFHPEIKPPDSVHARKVRRPVDADWDNKKGSTAGSPG